ncbi:hypothetical protein Tco_1436601, partial [Tanacetum coccineum]
MSTLKFADTYNMVAFLSKSEESKGFEQIINFWNANLIRYELTLQALVDRKKVVITKSIVRRDLHLEDANGMDCLPNATIFEELARIGSKTTAWNEFSSTMASVIICLARNQKFNFSKYIFESMIKNLEKEGKFLMYPRFMQVFMNQQLEGMANHKRILNAPCHTKIIFGNMNMVGKGFLGKDTPLFPTMIVQAQEDMGKGSTPSAPNSPIADEDILKDREDTIAQTRFENVSKHSNDPLLASCEDRLKLNELMELCTNLQQRVLDLENIKTAQAQEITSLKKRVKKLERRKKSRTHGIQRLYKVGSTRRVKSSDEGLGEEDASKQGRIDDIDADQDIYLVNVHRDEDMFGVNDLVGDEVIVDNVVEETVDAAK